MGDLSGRGYDRRFRTVVLTMVAGNAVIYCFGVPWLSHWVGFRDAVVDGFLPFLPGDALKLLLASLLAPLGWKLMALKNRVTRVDHHPV